MSNFFLKNLNNHIVYISFKNKVNKKLGIMTFKKIIIDHRNFLFIKSSNNNFKNNIIKFGGLSNYLTIKRSKFNILFSVDSMCSYPIFYYSHKDFFLLSTNLRLLVDVLFQQNIKAQICKSSFMEYILSSCIFSSKKTIFQGISRLEKSNSLSINYYNSLHKIIKNNNKDFYYEKQSVDQQMLTEQFSKTLISQLKKLRNKKIAIMLSGGADSRLIAIASIKAGLRPDFLTFGQSTANKSDYLISSKLSLIYGCKLIKYDVSSSNIDEDFISKCSLVNWFPLWHLIKIDKNFYKDISNYDLVLRGDGEGLYGWKDNPASIKDIIHKLEIPPVESLENFSNFIEFDNHIDGLKKNYKSLLIELKEIKKKYDLDLQTLQNIAYERIRLPNHIAPNLWLLNNYTTIENPLLWPKILKYVKLLKNKNRKNKKLIYDSISYMNNHNKVMFSSDSSWDDLVDDYISDKNLSFLEIINKNSEVEINKDNLLNYINKKIMNKFTLESFRLDYFIKKFAPKIKVIRILAFSFLPKKFNNSLFDRGLIKLTMIVLAKKYIKNIKQNKEYLNY